jgi:hypothetical protein
MTVHSESAINPPNTEQISRTKRIVDRAIIAWITIHVLIVLGWFIYWIDYNHQTRIAEPRDSNWILDILFSTAYAFPLMLVINSVILRIAIRRVDRFLYLLWILDATLLAAQIKFSMHLIQ